MIAIQINSDEQQILLKKKMIKLSLKKSRSLCEKKQTQLLPNPESSQKIQRIQSHVQEMIFQKYNFSHRFKTNFYQKPKKYKFVNKTTFITNPHIIAVTQFSNNQFCRNQASNKSLQDSLHKIRKKQKQGSTEKSPYTSIHPPIRKVSEYKDCIKRIEMNTTYRGFNFAISKLNDENRYPQPQKFSIQKNQDINKTRLKAAQRKMIIHHILEKGYARKMQDSLIKVRNEKIKFHYDLIAKKNSRASELLKTKRSQVFCQVESAPVYKVQTLRNLDGKQQLIEPW